MRNLCMLLLTVFGVMLLGPLGCVCLAAIPDKSRATMQEVASHVVVGRVVRVYRSVDHDSAAGKPTLGVVALRVERQDKGERLGPLVYARFWTKRAADARRAAPGDYGFRNIPEAGQLVRVYLLAAEDGGLDAVPPNGFAALAEFP